MRTREKEKKTEREKKEEKQMKMKQGRQGGKVRASCLLVFPKPFGRLQLMRRGVRRHFKALREWVEDDNEGRAKLDQAKLTKQDHVVVRRGFPNGAGRRDGGRGGARSGSGTGHEGLDVRLL